MPDVHLLMYPTLSYEGSAHRGDVKLQIAKILAKRITILSIIAQNYGSKAKYRMGNDPIPWGTNTPSSTHRWAQEAYHVVKDNSTDACLIVVIRDAFAFDVSAVGPPLLNC